MRRALRQLVSAQADEHVAAARSDFTAQQRTALRELLERDRAGGDLPVHADLDLPVDIAHGVLWYGLWYGRVDAAKEGKAEAEEYSGGQSTLLTFGHGTASAERMVSLLRDAGVSVLVDVRTVPGSRRHPHVARAELRRWLPEAGISYRWEKRLGGLRTPEADSPDVAFSVDSLRGYAGHMRTATFLTAVDQVLALASVRGTAVMCAESLWWRCHRRMVADFVTAVRGVTVRHLMHDGRLEEHSLSPGLRLRDDGLLVYDGGQPTLL